MLNIPGYKINNELYNGSKTIIYKGIREKDTLPVVIKLLKSEYPSPEDIKNFHYEYDIAKSLSDISGIINNYEIISYQNTEAIVMEDFDGKSLEKKLKTTTVTLKTFLDIAIKTADILEKVHRKNVIHKDIKPHNILLNPKTGEIKLIDFSLSCQLSKEVQKIINPDRLEGTLAYISPEQTGRMNRSIDYRTDFYSLGVSFYEILTQRRPFNSEDPMELIHMHIAKKPIPPSQINPEIPKALSNIIMKLLEKTAENRYISAGGLKADLEICQTMLNKKSIITDFTIGKKDISDRFQVPEKIYGRNREISYLMDIFEQVSQGSKELIFFSGSSGIGKTVVINEVQKPMVHKRGYFLIGKYDQFKKNIPYTAIIQAFQELVKQIITEKDEKINYWKEKILTALGKNGKVITSVIPMVELIIGKQPDVPDLPPTEAQNRFNLAFQNFVKIFATAKHPLVVFLDDLQWADNASLGLIEVLLTDIDLKYFLFIGAYRDNEVDSGHPFALMQERIKKEGLAWEDIKLSPLTQKDISEITDDTLHCNASETMELAQLILTKTAGNPFFVTEFLKTLYTDNLIEFKERWKWDLAKINQKDITDNVIELMANKINKLQENTLTVMKIACCIGVKFNIKTLAMVHQKSEEDTYAELKNAINEGMIIKADDEIRFVHDKVREATYYLLSNEQQQNFHYKIGKLLLAHPEFNTAEDRIFSIVNQLNLVHTLLNEEDKSKLIEINLEAGNKAKSSMAYVAALEFFTKGINLLPQDTWENQYKLTFALYKEHAECLYLTGKVDDVKKIVPFLLEKGQSIFDRLEIYSIEIQLYEKIAQYGEAITAATNALKELDIEFPQEETKLKELFSTALQNLVTQLKDKNNDDLFNLPESKDQKVFEALRFLLLTTTDSYITGNITFFGLSTIKMVEIILKNGNCMLSSYAYIYLQLLYTSILSDYNKSCEIGELAIRFADKYSIPSISTFVYHVFGTSNNHWKQHLKDTQKYYHNSIENGLISGNLNFTSYNYLHLASDGIILGTNLDEHHEKVKGYLSALKRMKNQPMYELTQACGFQPVLNLRGNIDKLTFNNNDFDENEYLKKYESLIIFHGHYYYCKLRSLYLFEYYYKAQEIAQKSEIAINTNLAGMVKVPEFYFYYSLTLAQIADLSDSDEEKKKLITKIDELQEKMKNWAELCPANFLHKYLLVEAEKCRILGNTEEAMAFYEQAIKEAKENDYINNEAIANELAAKFFMAKGINKVATSYMLEARFCYVKWGAKAKVEQLEQKYPHLFASLALSTASVGELQGNAITASISSRSSSGSLTTVVLDMSTILKASQTIAEEIEMDNLLSKLLKIMIENAGAQKGFLILKDPEGNLLIEAEGEVDQKEVKTLQSLPLEESENLSPAIIRYAAKTREELVFDNASIEGTFTKDPYVVKMKPISVLCLPIIKQDRLVALLYLENNLSPGTFTPARVETLKVLSSQAAISIENARMIEEMKEKERLKQEMELAERIQTSLVPPAPEHDEYDIAVCMEPAEEVGGDYYDIIFDRDNKLWIAVGDVSGHGMTPGLVMMMAETSFHTKITDSSGHTPSEAVVTVNKILTKNIRQRLKESHFMTMCFLKHEGDGKFSYAGSHLDIIVYRKETGKCDLYKTEGLYMGLRPDISKITSDKNFQVGIEDILVVYTDGIIECPHRDNPKNQFGPQALQDLIIKNANKSAENIKEAIRVSTLEWCANTPEDDITMVVLKRKK